jgi:phosphoserine phosphatase
MSKARLRPKNGRTLFMVSSSFSTTCTTVCGPIMLTQVLAPEMAQADYSPITGGIIT